MDLKFAEDGFDDWPREDIDTVLVDGRFVWKDSSLGRCTQRRLASEY